jgi:hypothetical protein
LTAQGFPPGVCNRQLDLFPSSSASQELSSPFLPDAEKQGNQKGLVKNGYAERLRVPGECSFSFAVLFLFFGCFQNRD